MAGGSGSRRGGGGSGGSGNRGGKKPKKTNAIQRGIEAYEEYFGDVASSYIENYVDFYMSALEYSVELYKDSIEYQNEQFTAYIDRATVILENSLNVMVSGVSKTANEIASMSMKNRMSEAKANVKARAKEVISEKEFALQKTKIINSLAEKVSKTSNDFAKAALTFYGQKGIGGALNDITKGASGKGKGGKGGKSAKPGKGEIALQSASLALMTAEAMKKGLDAYQSILTRYMAVDASRIEAEKQLYKQASEQLQSILDQGEKAVSSFMDLADEVRHVAEASDKVSHMQGVQMGFYGKQGDIYAKSMMLASEEVSKKFEKKTEDLINMQKAYMDESTRNVQMSVKDYENVISAGRAFGMSDTESSSLFGGMNVFNTSIESGADMLTGMYKTITKMGLSAKKFSSDLTNNLKLAQKYNFKGGVENVMKMTQWAEQTRIQMSSATNFAEKFLSGSISDALEASARLQVLGGSAAMYSDPIAMLYEAGADMGSFMRRQAALFNDISGTFDETIGETTFSWYENMMIKQRALAAGMSEEEAKNSIRQRHKQARIDNILRGSGLTEEEMTAIGNRATYNTKSKKWEVVDIHNKKHDINELKTNKALLNNLMPEDKNDALIDIAQRSLGFSEQQTRYQAYLANHFGAQSYDDIVDVSNQVMRQTEEFYTTMDNFMLENMSYMRHEQADAQAKEYKSIMDNPDAYQDIIHGYIDVVNKIATLDASTLNNLANMFGELAKCENVDKMIEYIYNDILNKMPSQKAFIPENLMAVGLGVYNDYNPKIMTGVFRDIISTGKGLADDFSTLGLKATEYFGMDLFSNLGIDAMFEGRKTLKSYLPILKNAALDVANKATEPLLDTVSGIYERLKNGFNGRGFVRDEDKQKSPYEPGGDKSTWYFDMYNKPETYPKRNIYEYKGLPHMSNLSSTSAPSASTSMFSLFSTTGNRGTSSASTGTSVAQSSSPWSKYGIKSVNVPYITTGSRGTTTSSTPVSSTNFLSSNTQTTGYEAHPVVHMASLDLTSANNTISKLSNVIASGDIKQETLTPIYSISSDISKLNNNVNRIIRMMDKNNGNSNNINLSNNIKVENSTNAETIKQALIAAIREDPNFNRALNDLISRGGESAYSLSGNNTSQTV